MEQTPEEIITQRWNELIAEGKTPQVAEQSIYREFIRTYGAPTVLSVLRELKSPRIVKHAEMKPKAPIFEGCQENDDGNVVDPITLDEIPEELLISFVENKKKYCFNIRTLAEYARRSKAQNPLTRNALLPEIMRRLEEYEEKERFVVSTIHVSGENSTDFITDLEVRHPKGDAFGELIIDVYRVLSDSINNSVSSIDILKDYIVSGKGFALETIINEPTELTVVHRSEKHVKSQTHYYLTLSEFCKKRYGLQAFAGAAEDTYMNISKDIPFIDSCLYFTEIYKTEPYLAHFSSRKHTGFGLLKTTDDYFRTSRDLFSTSNIALTKDMEFHPPPPDFYEQAKNMAQVLQKRKIKQLFLLQFNGFFQKALEANGYYKTLYYLELHEKVMERKYYMDVAVITNTFPPEQAYTLLEHISNFLLLSNVSKEFVTSGYFAKFHGITVDQEEVTKAFLGEKSNIINPITQAKVVGLTEDAKLFEQYKNILDYNTLYEYIAETGVDNIIELLSEEQKITLLFREGWVANEYNQDLIEHMLNNVIDNHPEEKFNMYAFGEVIRKLNVQAVLQYLYKAAESRAKNVFVSIVYSIPYNISGARDENSRSVFSDEMFIELMCEIKEAKRIPEDFKEAAFVTLFSQSEILNQSIDEIYNCIGPKYSLLGYEAAIKHRLDIPKLELSAHALKELLFAKELIAKAVFYEVISQTQLLALYKENITDVFLMEFFEKKYFDMIPVEEVLMYIASSNFIVSKGNFLENLHARGTFQTALAEYMFKNSILPKDVNVLSKKGFFELTMLFYKMISEGVPELSKSVVIISENK
jgi:hypothetical protein